MNKEIQEELMVTSLSWFTKKQCYWMIPCFLKRLLLSILKINQANKIIPGKKSVPYLQTKSLVRRKKEVHRQDILLHYMQQRPSSGFFCYSCYQPMTSNQNVKTCKDCFVSSANSTIQQEYMAISRKFLKKILSPKMALKIQ